MNAVYKTMMAYGALATSLLAQSNIDKLFTDEAIWAKSAKDATAEFPSFKWEVSADKAVLKNSDIRLWNRDVDALNIVSRAGFLRSLNVLVDTTQSKSDFSNTLEEWVAVFDANLKIEHSEDAFKGKDGSKSLTYRWKVDSYYIYLTGTAKGSHYSVQLSCKPKVKADIPGHIAATPDRFDGIYEREFYTPDYSKSFKGRIVSFDQGKETIAIQTKKSTISVSLDKLSDRDVAYYEEIKDLVIASKSLSLSIKENKAKASRSGRAITVDTNFAIGLGNRSAHPIQDLEVKYITYHKVDTLDGSPVLTSTSGSLDIASLYGNYRETVYTDIIGVVRETEAGVSGG